MNEREGRASRGPFVVFNQSLGARFPSPTHSARGSRWHPKPDRSSDHRAAAVSPSGTATTHRQSEAELQGTVEQVQPTHCAETVKR